MWVKKLIPATIRKAMRRARRLRGSSSSAVAKDPIDFGPVRVLSTSPPVLLTGIPYNEYLGIAGAFGQRYGNVEAGFVVFPTWSLEGPGRPQGVKARLDDHLAQYPRHSFRFVCNTLRETTLLNDAGIAATFLNKNFTVSDQIFRPLEAANVEFDAIYVARLVPEKRHELAVSVPRVSYVAYMEMTLGERQLEERREQFRELRRTTLAQNSSHALLNELSDGLPVGMSHDQVNAALNRAAVGLILSDVEGSSYASMEYMLAGLPVVSTPSKGGREVFFDPEYCIICDPNPEAVRDAVAELKGRNIPRELIRARTLAKIQPERERFLAMVDDFIEELGGRRRFDGFAWPFGDISGVPWNFFDHHLEDFRKCHEQFALRQRNELTDELGLGADALEGVQLEASELRPIIAAIKERPGCSLLVFGCGRDSAFWEKVNAKGTTAFLEDDPDWAALARAALATSSVHVVSYGTKLPDWHRLIDRPSELDLDLPEEIRARSWDVILVDGPGGYRDDLPGRMKSIFAASRLVSPGGCVFVHDCERPAEEAFASRYLGEERMYVEAQGRAILRGYAF